MNSIRPLSSLSLSVRLPSEAAGKLLRQFPGVPLSTTVAQLVCALVRNQPPLDATEATALIRASRTSVKREYYAPEYERLGNELDPATVNPLGLAAPTEDSLQAFTRSLMELATEERTEEGGE